MGFRWLEELLQDLHYGLRMLMRSPGSAMVAVLTFALGIGANTAIFTLLHGLFLRSLPVSRPGELARINLIDPAQGSRPATALVPWQMFELLRLQQRSFVDISAWTFRSIHVRDSEGTLRMCGAALLTGNAFEILGVKPHLASVLGHPRWFAQKIAYCLRQSGSLQLSGKKATRLYTPASHLHRDQIVPQLAVRARWRQWLPMMIRLITPTNASTPLLTEVLNIVQRAA